jgi:hypothetical protein
MEKNFTICPHCFAKGKERVIRPATPQRTPLVSRSDGNSFHLYAEESHVRRAPAHQGFELVALFRYDLDHVGVKSESTMVQLPVPANHLQSTTDVLEEAADRLAEILAKGIPLKRMYSPDEIQIGGDTTAA